MPTNSAPVDPVIVDVGTCAQYVYGGLQVLDHLDLLGRIQREERQPSCAASEWRIDRNYDCTVLGVVLPEGGEVSRLAGMAVHDHHAGSLSVLLGGHSAEIGSCTATEIAVGAHANGITRVRVARDRSDDIRRADSDAGDRAAGTHGSDVLISRDVLQLVSDVEHRRAHRG
jgi:hypothetical protein